MAAPRQCMPSELRYSAQRLRSKDLADQYDLNQKRAAKWHKRSFVHDAFQGHTLLPLADCLYAFRATIRRLTL